MKSKRFWRVATIYWDSELGECKFKEPIELEGIDALDCYTEISCHFENKLDNNNYFENFSKDAKRIMKNDR